MLVGWSMSLPSLCGAIYPNDTGVIAYGFKIVFAAPVTIVSHAPVFPAQDPLGEAVEFTFSGGEIAPGESFWLSWRPADVAVAGYAWLTSSQGKLAGSGEERAQEPDELESTPTSPSEPYLREEAIIVTLRSGGGGEQQLAITRRLSDRMIPFLVEYAAQGGDGLSLTWDLNHCLDSDGDGQFRNDADAVGREARTIYFSNRTPYTVTLWAEDAAGRIYRWEDQVSFNVQNGDEIFLDAKGFVQNASSVEWLSFNGDSRDTNFRIVSPNRLTTYMHPTYPGVTEVTARITDDSGNIQEFVTKLYVFNRDPEMFQMRGIRFGFPPAPHADMDYISLAFDLAKEYGFNFLLFNPIWVYSKEGDSYIIRNPGVQSRFENDYEVLRQLIELAHQKGVAVSLNLSLSKGRGTTLSRWQIPPTYSFFFSDEGFFHLFSNISLFVMKRE